MASGLRILYRQLLVQSSSPSLPSIQRLISTTATPLVNSVADAADKAASRAGNVGDRMSETMDRVEDKINPATRTEHAASKAGDMGERIAGRAGQQVEPRVQGFDMSDQGPNASPDPESAGRVGGPDMGGIFETVEGIFKGDEKEAAKGMRDMTQQHEGAGGARPQTTSERWPSSLSGAGAGRQDDNASNYAPGPSSDINQNPAEAVTSGPNPATAMDHAQTDPLSKLGQGKDGVPPL